MRRDLRVFSKKRDRHKTHKDYNKEVVEEHPNTNLPSSQTKSFRIGKWKGAHVKVGQTMWTPPYSSTETHSGRFPSCCGNASDTAQHVLVVWQMFRLVFL